MEQFLQQKTLRTLELPRVLTMLAACAESEEAKAWALELTPEHEVYDVERLQDETTEAAQCIGRQGGPSFSGLRPMQDIVSRAGRGGTLSMRELLQVASLLRCARSLADYAGEPKRERGCLDVHFQLLMPVKSLENAIVTAILSEDELSDHASPALADIRRKMRAASSKVKEVLQRIVASRSKALQDAIITQRNGRYVVPVKSEHKNDINGLVHDVSSSGATFFVEPVEVVNLNNEIHEWEAAEQAEIERILAALTADVAAHGQPILDNHDALLSLDCIFARAKLSYQMHAARPTISERPVLRLKRARHPLLDRKTAVPISLSLGDGFDTLIITGPNTGGKTVALKTIGLLSLMAACGLHIPADDGSQIPVYRAVLADIGDEQSIEQSLSTFSAHMTNIVAILKLAGPQTLVLFDELGAGTDPVEGAALAQSIIANARALGAQIAATTHYAELKVYALTTEGVENAACEFDVETLKPTYRLLIGVPGKSNAFAISRRLGLDERVIEDAGRHIEAGDAALEDVLSELEKQRQQMESARAQAEDAARQASSKHELIAQMKQDIEAERNRAVERAKAEALAILDEARAAADVVYEEVTKLRRKAEKGDYSQMQEARLAMKRQLNQAEKEVGVSAHIAKPKEQQRPLVIGDTVEMLRLGGQGTVVSLPDKDGRVELQAGILKVKAHVGELRLLEQARATVERQHKPSATGLQMRSAPMEIDVRGQAVEEALPEIDAYIDSAAAAKLETVRIIHGKGTGVLRSAVQKHLKSHRQVKSFRLGRYGEGEDGVTIITMK